MALLKVFLVLGSCTTNKISEIMSQAFVREGEEQSLAEITPTLNSLFRFLSGENNGVRVYERKQYQEGERTVYVMSNGLSYTKDSNGRWMIKDN